MINKIVSQAEIAFKIAVTFYHATTF